MIKVSIIVPVYNTEKELNNCLESLANQKYKDIEIIIINDGSTDNSEHIIKQYENKYGDIIKYYYKENTGIADTRNLGVKKANGKYILFVDSDDYIDMNLLKNLEDYIEQDIDLIKFKLKRVDKNKKEIEKVDGAIFEKESGQEGFNKLYYTDVLLDSPCVYLIKKELITKNKFEFKINTEHEDFGLIPLIILSAKTMVSIDFYGYNYVQSNNSITRNEDYTKTIKKVNDVFTHYDNMIISINNMKLSKVTKQNIKIYYTNSILLKINELKNEDKDIFIKEIKKRKMVKNIKVRNLKQLIKKIILYFNIKLYLKIR